jgi:hypothetical protein
VGAAAAAALVDDMRGDGLNPDVPIASALICAYGVLGQFTNAERMLRAVEAATAVAYAGGAEASGRGGRDIERGGGRDRGGAARAAAAVETTSGRHESKCKNTSNGSTFREVLQQQTRGGGGGSRPPAPRPDPKLYTEYLIAACRCGRPEAATEVFESANFPRTSYTCTAAIKAYGGAAAQVESSCDS